jgi:ABC-type multidrug transport system fused ATPase/permease subunit
VLFFFDPVAGAILLFITFFTFFVLTLFDKKLIPGYNIENKAENRISEKVFDILSNITTIIILRAQSLSLGSIDQRIRDSFSQFDKNNLTNEWKWCFASLAGRLALIIVIGIYILSHMSGGIMVGTIYILYGYTNQVRQIFFRFAYLYNDIVRYRSSVANSEALSQDFLPEQEFGKKRLSTDWKDMEIKDLSFSYPSSGEKALDIGNSPIIIEKGERIALIGESGGGKTTFLKILRGLYEPQVLEVSLEGDNFFCFDSISDSISLIPQDPEIFATTIRENITLGVDHSDIHLKVFTDMACFSDIIEGLPNKLESSIFEKGVNLSGGEKQRLALARGLLASVDKDIILLDEPTSSVDFQNELDIFKNIFESFPRQTVIASVHRLHLLSLFDRVYYFDQGSIIASGTFQELKQNSPEFKILWEKYEQMKEGE